MLNFSDLKYEDIMDTCNELYSNYWKGDSQGIITFKYKNKFVQFIIVEFEDDYTLKGIDKNDTESFIDLTYDNILNCVESGYCLGNCGSGFSGLIYTFKYYDDFLMLSVGDECRNEWF